MWKINEKIKTEINSKRNDFFKKRLDFYLEFLKIEIKHISGN